MMAQTAGRLLLIRPSHFGYNSETAVSNNFQNQRAAADTGNKARQEFDGVIKLLSGEHIDALVIDDKPGDKTPDAVFPNN